MKHYIITIARGFGSGGKTIGLELSKLLQIPCYEEEILDMASEESGISKNLFHESDEKVRGNLLMKKLKGMPKKNITSPREKDFISDVNLFNIQKEIIKTLADKESCIIVGKCADYVLEGRENVFSIYVDAPREACIEGVIEKMSVSREKAEELIVKTDKYRANYYKFYTGKEWNSPVNYDLIINSARVGRDKCADLIKTYLEFKIGKIEE